MKVIVQKFGGTSLKSKESRDYVLKHIQRSLNDNYKVIVVVSALGRFPQPYATDSLLQLVNAPHTNASKRELDLLLSCGEIISAVVVSNELKVAAIKATALTGAQAGIVTTEQHTNARIQHIYPKRVVRELEQHDVVVVAGFQGETIQGDVTTIGRGGSDTTAVALAVAMNAERAEIYTDVAGIMTADPKIVETAKVLPYCTYEETCNLAYQGAKVIHPHAVEMAMQAKLPLHIRSTYKQSFGTLISATHQRKSKIPVTGIAHVASISQIKVSRKANRAHTMTEIFKYVAAAGISIDFVTITPNQIAFTVPKRLLHEAKEIFHTQQIVTEIVEDCAKVAVVGSNMSTKRGILANVVSALANKDIQILQATDGETSIAVLIPEKCLTNSINTLHDTFRLSDDKEAYVL